MLKCIRHPGSAISWSAAASAQRFLQQVLGLLSPRSRRFILAGLPQERSKRIPRSLEALLRDQSSSHARACTMWLLCYILLSGRCVGPSGLSPCCLSTSCLQGPGADCNRFPGRDCSCCFPSKRRAILIHGA